MADVHFRCLGCQQSLVADESGAGVSFCCPHCNTAQAIPSSSVSPQPAQAGRIVASKNSPDRAQSGSNGHSTDLHEQRWQDARQSTDRVVELVERDQRISALKAECDWLTAQLDEERARRQAIEPELDAARNAWAAAEKRAGEYEAGYSHAAARLQHAEIAVQELTHQLELVKTERSEAVLNLAQQHDTFAELNLQLERARADRTELEQILGRARAEIDRLRAEYEAAESLAEESAAETEQLRATNGQLQAALQEATAHRDKLQSLVREDHDLAEYVAARTDRDQFEADLREAQSRLDGYVEKIDQLTTERESLKRERTELQLRVAALRDAHDESQLQQDNEILRRMVERLNEELKEAHPEIAKRKRRESSGGVVGGLARAALARCFVPDPDVAEGR